jgi:hypothetical protein
MADTIIKTAIACFDNFHRCIRNDYKTVNMTGQKRRGYLKDTLSKKSFIYYHEALWHPAFTQSAVAVLPVWSWSEPGVMVKVPGVLGVPGQVGGKGYCCTPIPAAWHIMHRSL